MQLSDKKLLKTQAYINGEWVDGDGGDTFAVTDPATGESIAEVASCGTTETRRAIEAAATAMIAWRKRNVKDRAGILRKWFKLMRDAQEVLVGGVARRQLRHARAQAGALQVLDERGQALGALGVPVEAVGRMPVVGDEAGCHAADCSR